MDKKQRQRAILKIISSQEVETQEQLGELLAEAGYPTTQATVSRDMRELKIRKGMAENGVNCYYSRSARIHRSTAACLLRRCCP